MSAFSRLAPEEAKAYDDVLTYLTPSAIGHKTAKIFELSFSEVAEIKSHAADGNIEALFKIFFGIGKRDFARLRVTDFYKGMNYIKDELEGLHKAESLLSGAPDHELQAAGADKLNRFGDLNLLISIGEQFGTPPQEVEKWEYALVLNLALYAHITAEIQKNLFKKHKAA